MNSAKREECWEGVVKVRQIDNVLDLFEVFGREKVPMTLTDISNALEIPKSSAFNVIETLVGRGYLYETQPRRGYYPTALLFELSSSIADGDPLVQRIHPQLVALAEATGETVLISTRERNENVYLDVVEAASPIRYFARIGQRRALHTTSSGKAILATYDEKERQRIVAALSEAHRASPTPVDIAALATDVEACIGRGWSEDWGQTAPDVMGIGVPIHTSKWRLGLALAGPIYRMQDRRDDLIARLLAARTRIVDLIGGTG